jgi:hypothetical protein
VERPGKPVCSEPSDGPRDLLRLPAGYRHRLPHEGARVFEPPEFGEDRLVRPVQQGAQPLVELSVLLETA